MNIKSKVIAIAAFAVATSFAQQAENTAAEAPAQDNAAPAASPAEQAAAPVAEQTVKTDDPAPDQAQAAAPAKEAAAEEADQPKKPRNAKEAKEAREAAAANKSLLKASYVDPEEFYGDIANGKKPRGKITYAEYEQKQKEKQDSIVSVNLHHGVTLMGASTNDTRYGDLDEGFVWSGGMGLYYFYRHDFLTTMVLQGRFGVLYRYGRFNYDEDAGSKTLSNGKKLDLTCNTEVTYRNISLDLPLEIKFGGHIEPTTFLFVGFTLGITKPMGEQTAIVKTLEASSSDKAVAKDLEYLAEKGLSPYPLEKREKIKEPFYMDDWETNGWIGAGIDGKYVSAELQFLLASGSTVDNHRYHHLFYDTNPTWRVMVDFSMR